tara:strand:+ start:169 stop:1248 length:1080 start_codon:yes stop_codon:yes gene_type:complete
MAHLRLILLLAATLLSRTNANSQEKNNRFARVVLFAEEGSTIPENYQDRLGSLAIRTEGFIDQWMNHWERPIDRKEIFARNDDGSVQVTLLTGKLLNANGRAALPDIQSKATKGASEQLDLAPDKKTVWWIFYHYPGVKGFQGGARGFGGVAINAYPDGEGIIDPGWDLASPPMVENSLKGTIHEFGHALGLPHIGPRPALKLGNSLMGPINKSYWSKAGTDDERVYLNEVSAAMLWKHPLFSNENTNRVPTPRDLEVTDFKGTKSEDGNSIELSGRIMNPKGIHSVIAVDSERGQFGDYWARSYVGKVDPETGIFKAVITEPFQKGTAYIAFSFEDGFNTGDGKMPFQRGSSISYSYP